MHIFDIIGPVMIGPSSSHTAGAAKIGYVTRKLLGERPVQAEILLHGSFSLASFIFSPSFISFLPPLNHAMMSTGGGEYHE